MDKLTQLIRSEYDRKKLAEILWPESNEKSRRVLLLRWRKEGIKTFTLAQFRAICEFFGVDANKIVEG